MAKSNKSKLDKNYESYVKHYYNFKKSNFMEPIMSKREYKRVITELKSINTAADPDIALIRKNPARYIAGQQRTLTKGDVNLVRELDAYKNATVKELKKKNWLMEFRKYNPESNLTWTDAKGVVRKYTNRQAWYFLMRQLGYTDEEIY